MTAVLVFGAGLHIVTTPACAASVVRAFLHANEPWTAKEATR